jgi:hypothetical protein
MKPETITLEDGTIIEKVDDKSFSKTPPPQSEIIKVDELIAERNRLLDIKSQTIDINNKRIAQLDEQIQAIENEVNLASQVGIN